MRKVIFSFLFMAFLVISSNNITMAEVQNFEVNAPFSGAVLIEGLDNPWDIDYGRDNMLWVTERTGKKISRINPVTGERKIALTIDEVRAEGQHFGLLGMAFEPSFLQKKSNNFIYVFYTYMPKENSPEFGYKKLVRYKYDVKSETLKNPKVILDKIPAGNDHNGGRVVFAPDGKIHISLGELGHNPGGSNLYKVNEAQRLPTASEIREGNFESYVGKTLRINVDGSIPSDNPVLNGVRSHVYTYGHRNPQGLVFAGNYLYSCEHGPASDDEINLLESGGNYGWPHVAGFRDDKGYQFVDWPNAPKDVTPENNATFLVNDSRIFTQKETEWNAPENYKDPVKTFYTVNSDYDFHDPDTFGGLSYSLWPTIGASSLAYYKEGPIAGWENSLIMTSLKNGTIYKVKLNQKGNNVQGDVETFFVSQNRYRDICISPDNTTMYVITDSRGTALDENRKPTSEVQNPGAVIVIKYNPNK